MKRINLKKGEGASVKHYPDGQPHVQLRGDFSGEEVVFTHAIKSAQDAFLLLQVSNALDHAGAIKNTLFIPYLLCARFDRLMEKGDSFDLEVMAAMINLCGWPQVMLVDVHSEVALDLIEWSHSVSNRFLVEKYDLPDAVLIIPDKGAAVKAADYPEWNPNLKDVVQ